MLNYIDSNDEVTGCGPLLQADAHRSANLRQHIFQHVRAQGRAARADISRALGISAGSATTLTADLIAANLLREVDAPPRETGRGRPPVALELVPQAAYVIGIKLASKRHCAVLCDFAGTVLGTASVPSSAKRRSVSVLLDEIAELAKSVTREAGKSEEDIKAIGIGVPGIVDQPSGLIRWCSLLHDTNVDLANEFNARSNAPLFVDNDTNMLTLAELWFGAGRDKTDFAVVTIENGVGMGLVINNHLYRGTHGIGLELGHTKVQLDGALCRCGQRGCLEAYLGDYALTREVAIALDADVQQTSDPDTLLDMLFEQAKAGHSAAGTIFRRAGRYLSIGLSNVVQLFDPPLIIISGERTRHELLFSEDVLNEMQNLTLSEGRQPCVIEIHKWDDQVWARGATVPALMALTDVMVGGQQVQGL